MSSHHQLRLQFVVFALVAASFTNVYITQPVLPVIQDEFQASVIMTSYTIAAVILGIALANIPFGALADRVSIRPIILAGTIVVSVAGLVCAFADDLRVLIAARFLQGLFIPALTTCLAAYLSRSLPVEKLTVIMGSFVSATVIGGLGGRLLGGFIHPPLDWRYAFISAAILIVVAGSIALYALPKEAETKKANRVRVTYFDLVKRWDLARIYIISFSGFFVFSSVFNYLPFRLEAAPFTLKTEWITLLYVTYLVGVVMGPTAGKITNRFGGGFTLIAGTLVLAGSVLLTLIPSMIAILVALFGICAGFFTLHAAAVGLLNHRIQSGQGRANALYVLFYYVGGWIGITLSGLMFDAMGWDAVVAMLIAMLTIPLIIGLRERLGPLFFMP